jgi:transcriptional regulator with XRE-family HTH domain
VGVSNTIQARHYTARQAALFQQRPSDIIEASENALGAFDTLHSGMFHVVYMGGRPQALNAIAVGLSDAGNVFGKLMTAYTGSLLNSLRQSTSPVLDLELDELHGEKTLCNWARQAKEALQKAVSKERRPPTASARFRVERLAALQAAFGFTTQDLAAVLGVSRQQLYNWLDAANDVRLQEASRARLSAVERIAKEWTSYSRAPLSSVSREALAGGSTVFTMLSADVIDEAAIVIAFDELLNKLQAAPKTRSQRLREAGFTRRVSSLPLDE